MPQEVPSTDGESSHPRHRKPRPPTNLPSASSTTVHKDTLVPSVRVNLEVIHKSRSSDLSACADSFSQAPVRVHRSEKIITVTNTKRTVSPADIATFRAHTPPASTTERVSVPMAVATLAPPKSNAWSKGPPAFIKKVRSLKKVTIADIGHKRNLSVNLNAPLKTPTSAGSLAVPMSAMSLWTESDPATPFDPMTHRKKMLEIEEETKENGRSKAISKSGLGNLAFDSSPAPSQVFSPPESFLPFTAPAYSRGMPMSLVSLGAYQNSLAPDVEGGLGVIWTPTGWAVQDAAMKHALRNAEVKLKFENVKRGKPKSYYRSMSHTACRSASQT